MERWIECYVKRLQFGRFLESAAEWLAGFCFVFGSSVLVVKLLAPNMWPHVLWLGLAAIPVTGVAYFISRRERYTRAESIALLDRRLNAGGLLMTLAEVRDGQWADELPQEEVLWRESLPKIRPVRFARYLSLPLVFALGSCLVPLREAGAETVRPNVVGRQASEQLEEMLAVLDEAKVLEEEEQKQLREEIEKLAEETKNKPLTHEKWEAVDALRDRMTLRLDSKSLLLSKAREAAAALAKASAGENLEALAERIGQLEKDVLETLQKMAKNGELSRASGKLQSELQRLIKDGQFKLPDDPAERQKLLDDLQEFLDQEWDKLAELREKCPDCKDGTCPDCGGAKSGGT